MNQLSRFAFAGVLGAGMACSPVDRDRRATAVAAADTISLDSCSKLDAKSAPQSRVLEPGETIPAPHPGSWTATKRLVVDSFQLDVPATANAASKGADATYWISDLPGCRYFCAIAVTFVTDSVERSLDQYVASLRVVDTTKNPDAEMSVPGPAHHIRLAGSDGLVMETPCGDCTAAQILTKRGRTIAFLNYSLDDRDGYQPGLSCRLARVAATFAWRP